MERFPWDSTPTWICDIAICDLLRNIAISQCRNIAIWNHHSHKTYRKNRNCVIAQSAYRKNHKSTYRKRAESQKAHNRKMKSSQKRKIAKAHNKSERKRYLLIISVFCAMRSAINAFYIDYFCYGCIILFQEQFYYNLS